MLLKGMKRHKALKADALSCGNFNETKEEVIPEGGAKSLTLTSIYVWRSHMTILLFCKRLNV
jgi:hypothetical protein